MSGLLAASAPTTVRAKGVIGLPGRKGDKGDKGDIGEIDASVFGVSASNSGAANRTALLAAIASARLDQTDIYFAVVIVLPRGKITLDGNYQFGRDGLSIGFRGRGTYNTTLLLTSTAADVPIFDYDFADPAQSVPNAAIASQIIFRDMTLIDYVSGNNARSKLSSDATFKNVGRLDLTGLVANPIGGKGIVIDGVNALTMSETNVDAYNNTALELRGTKMPVSGSITNSRFRLRGIGGPTAMQGPPVRISGTQTGLVWNGNRVGGAGPRYICPNQLVLQSGSDLAIVLSNPALPDGLKIASVSWASGNLDVGTATPHSFTAGDVVGIYNVAPAMAYYKLWTVASVPSASTVRFAAASNPGAATFTNGIIGFPAFQPGDDLILQGVVPAAYNGRYTVKSMDDVQTARVTAPQALGNATTPGTASSCFASVLIDNEYGPNNEATYSGGIIEGVVPSCDKALDGSYAVVIDATRNNLNIIYSLGLSIGKLDAGHRNIKVFGNLTSGLRSPCEVTIATSRGIAPGGNIVLSGPCSKIDISGFVGVTQHGFDETAFGYAAGLRFVATPKGAPLGVTLNGGQLGAPLGGTTGTGAGYPYAIVFDGDGTNLVTVNGTILAGTTLPVAWINGATPANMELDFRPGAVVTGAWPTDFTVDLAPLAVASAGALALPAYGKPFRVAGQSSGTVANLSGAWKGRTGQFTVETNALAVDATGNIAAAGTFAVGTLVTFVYRGGKYFLK